jgi:monovalent cation/hydrogen antiporter
VHPGTFEDPAGGTGEWAKAEIVVVGLLVAVVGLSALARRLSLPYPIVLVPGGALLGFVPGLPKVRLDPEVVLLIFLPLLLYGSSIFANFNDFRATCVGWRSTR